MILTSYSVTILLLLDSFETYGAQNYNGNYIEADSLWRMLSCIRSYMKELMIYDESDPIEIAVKDYWHTISFSEEAAIIQRELYGDISR